MPDDEPLSFYEDFAGVGAFRLGLSKLRWRYTAGNAVTINVITAIGQAMEKHLR